MAEKQLRESEPLPDDAEPTPAFEQAHGPLRVMSRADYAVQVKEHTMAQPETHLVVRGDEVVAEFDTAEDAAAYVEDND